MKMLVVREQADMHTDGQERVGPGEPQPGRKRGHPNLEKEGNRSLPWARGRKHLMYLGAEHRLLYFHLLFPSPLQPKPFNLDTFPPLLLIKLLNQKGRKMQTFCNIAATA